MDSLDSGSELATGLEVSYIIFGHSFNSWNEVEGSGEGRDVLNSVGIWVMRHFQSLTLASFIWSGMSRN